MEAVPRLPMIWFQLKASPAPTSFAKLKQYIRDFYNEDPESYTNEIHQLEALRAMAVRPSTTIIGCPLLKKYYCQLHFVQSRFPMGNDEPAAVPFSWRDAYSNMVFTLSNIRFEMISILYNIGSIHTQMGAKTVRTSADGMKMACSHFQCAAWAFEHLQNCYPQPPGVDMSPDLMKFMHQLCLAQAQECILEKSMLDNRKPTIVAKVAKQIVDYYAESNNSEDNTIVDTVGSKFYKTLKSYVKFKRAYYMAVTLLYQGLASEEQQKMGERVAFYNAALISLNAARSIHTGVNGSTGITGIAGEKEAIEDALVFTNDVIEGKRKAAKNENEFIYHEEVPDKDVLPTVNGASLVKGISFNVNDAEISGPDIFARLIPMKVHEASSLYSEEKAKILRSVSTRIEEKDQLLEMYLASLKLQHLGLYDPDCSPANADNLPLPEELAERCAALNAKPSAIQDLEDIMAKLSATYGDVETMLKDIDKFLTDEDQKEKQYQETMGMRPPTIVATDLTREAKKYDEAHAKASESNQALHRAMTMHLNNLQVLSQPLNELMASIPSINGGTKIESEVEKQHVRELKRILGKVEEMQRQRNELHTKLRESISQDNLTRILVTATAESTPLDTLFSEHLEKHQSLVNVIDQNLAAQDNVLSALTDTYARTAETRKSVEEILKRRDLMISSLIASYDAYEDLLAKSSKGLEFYRKLEVNVMKLLQRVKSTCRVQEEEREQILARNGKDSCMDPTIMVSEPEKRIGSGMKLRDHLANRLKNNSTHSTNYGEKQTIPVAPIQQNALAPTTPYPTDNIIGPDGMPIIVVPTVTADTHAQDSSTYQYYPYTNYYMGQRNSYVSQQYNSYDATNYNGINQSLPTSSTTNTDQMYHQAGAGTSTEVASNSVQYAGYNNIRNDQGPVPSTNQAQYPTHAGYQESSNFPQYQTYNAGQGYQTPNAAYPYVSGQQTSYSQSHPTNNLPPIQSPSHMSTSNQQVGQSQMQSIPQQSTSQLPNVSLQYEPTMQVPNCDGYIHSYGPATQNEPGSSNSQTNYSIGTHATINANPPSKQQPSQIYPSDTSNLQYAALNSHHALAPSNVMNPGYTVPEQYLPTQITAVNPNDASMRTTYSGSPSNMSSTNSIDQQHYYHPNTQSNSFQPTPAYVLTPQQGYIDQTSVVGQSSIPSSQVPMTTPIQTYPNAYGHIYSVDTNSHQYQMQQGPLNSIAAQGLTMNYVNDPEIIQSHAKSSNMQGYLQNYQCSQQDQQSGITQYPNYSQSYNNTWDNKQIHNSMSNSYKGHPGYSYDATAGNYQYSSGYQDSRDGSQQNPIEVSGDGHANSHYTNANNAATTNLTTSSQYSNGTYQPQLDGQNYDNISYNIQTSKEGTTVTNNPTNTNNTQTYVQSSNNGTITSNSEMEKSNSDTIKSKSNLDLLAELDIAINHAPLVPEVPVSDDEQKDATKSLTPDFPNESFDEKENDGVSLQIDDKHENLQIVWDTWYNDVQPKKDPLGDPLILQKFITDIEKYEKFVDSLTVKTLSGSTSIDIKWKEIQDNAERECKKQSSTIALTHSSENRSSDWIPYDATRVKLSALHRSSDYINASYVKDLTQWTPSFIVTQAPKSQSFEAFWSMIWEQGSEVIACLCDDTQLSGDVYWPTSKEIMLNIGNFSLSLKNSTNHMTHIQRVIGMAHSERKIERIVVHMQYLGWPSSGLPSSPGPLLSFATDIMSEQALRHCPKPIVIHCYVGGPLSSIFLLAAATVCHVRAGHGVVDVPLVFSTLVKYRRCWINKELLLFGYRMVRYHAQDTLMKRGILSSTKSTFDGFDGMKGRSINKHCHPSDDFLHNLGVGIQHGLVRQPGKDQTIGPSQSTITVKSEEETDRAKPIDPLSQLDPLWSIRR